MKTLLSLLACAMILSLPATAQENKTIKEETTVKRVVKKEGSKVVIKETEDVETESGAVIVRDDGNEAQEDKFFEEESEVSDRQDLVVDEEKINKANEAEIAALKKKEEEELQRSIAEAKAKAEAERKALEEAEAARMKALEENRKKLERRGKGVGKLQKKRKKRGN